MAGRATKGSTKTIPRSPKDEAQMDEVVIALLVSVGTILIFFTVVMVTLGAVRRGAPSLTQARAAPTASGGL